MAQQERPNAQRDDQDRPFKSQTQGGTTSQQDEDTDLDQPMRHSQQTSQQRQQQAKSSKAGDEGCGCAG